ncbi:MAG TPA: superinfection immunity protein [Stellaceae bacterium]|nr:superinfection immunity protein [Stellaceae bacterium]
MFGSTSTVLMLMAIVLLYMLPTIIAVGRGHPRRQDLAVANILFGWTLIGWIAVFLWASLAHAAEEPA